MSSKDEDSQLVVSEVKSKAIVKYASIDTPAQFQQLQINTDLNNPPSNWLHGRSKWESYIQSASISHERSPFLSFHMANCYPDLAGEIDVVSDSENIKKLLKLAYSKSNLSMMVHRVGNTVMLDDFDIHRYLLRQQGGEWKWLQRFFLDTVLQKMEHNVREKCVIRENKTRDHLRSRNMFSKFLHYSMTEGETSARFPADVEMDADSFIDAVSSDDSDDEQDSSIGSMQSTNRPASLSNVDNEIESNLMLTDHQRTVVWTFENIHMLIGTDLPIFGGNTHPCVSLRLRDMSKPINVLTGIDYWLDNLICNVPELAMYYHDNGIVQSYELIKTEDIPNLDNSKFSPHVIRDVAQNILSFLKSNATKEGHTYWLFKGHDDEIVKLYDLTTLCATMMDDVHDNPFTVPVGVLLYRVARNMREMSPQKSNVICALLKNCLDLLNVNKHAQLVTSAHYLLSDIYVSNQMEGSDTRNNVNNEDDDQNEQGSSVADDESSDAANEGAVHESNSQEEAKLQTGERTPQSVDTEVTDSADNDLACLEIGCNNVALISTMTDGEICVPVKTLCSHEQVKKSNNADQNVRYPPITGTVDERCAIATQHITKGLGIVHRQTILGSNLSGRGVAEEQQAQCDPNQAIPLHYHPLHEQNCKSDHKPMEDSLSLPPDIDLPLCTGLSPYRLKTSPPEDSSGVSADDWCTMLKVMLTRKASVVCFKLSKAKLDAEQFGLALNLARQALYCFAAVKHWLPSRADCNQSHVPYIASLCGDIQRGLARCQRKGLQQHLKDFSDRPLETAEMMDLIIDEDIKQEYEYLCEFGESSSVESCLQRSIEAYSVAVRLSSEAKMSLEWQMAFNRQRGNALNELGIHYMNQAALCISQSDQYTLKDIEQLAVKSLDCLSKGIAFFDDIEDSINAAMLYCNCGKVHRLCAQAVVDMGSTLSKKHEFTAAERQYFDKAIESYSTALDKLCKSRSSDKMTDKLKQSISWDLSSVYYTIGTSLQDCAPVSSLSQQQIETEAAEAMEKALKYCKAGLESAEGHQQFMVQYRVANINHRLASLFHNALRNESNSERRKRCRLKAESHYEIAFKHFVGLSDVSCLDPIRVQLERVALCEYQLSNQTSCVNRIKTLERSLDFLVECRAPLTVVLAQLPGNSAAGDAIDGSSMHEEAAKLVAIIEARLRATLLALAKNSSAPNKNSQKDKVQLYKSLYALSLTSSKSPSSSVSDLCSHQCNILTQIAQKIASSAELTTCENGSQMT